MDQKIVISGREIARLIINKYILPDNPNKWIISKHIYLETPNDSADNFRLAYIYEIRDQPMEITK